MARASPFLDVVVHPLQPIRHPANLRLEHRDSCVLDASYRFDVTRKPNHHLEFGHGAHFCPGANLTRVELPAAIRALLPILPRMELADRGERVPNLYVPGLRSLGVRSRGPLRSTTGPRDARSTSTCAGASS